MQANPDDLPLAISSSLLMPPPELTITSWPITTSASHQPDQKIARKIAENLARGRPWLREHVLAPAFSVHQPDPR